MQPQWVRARSNSAPDSTTSDFIGLTADKGYIVAGHMSGTTQFGSTSFSSGGRSNSDIFVVCYDSLGQERWAQRAASTDNDILRCFALDAQGNSYLATRASTAPFRVGSLPAAPSSGAVSNAIFARVSALGRPDWIVRTAGISGEQGTGIVADAGRAVYCAGQFLGNITLGNTTLMSVGGADFFIARLDGGRPVGVSDQLASSSLSVYPNPVGAGGTVRLDVGKPLREAATLTLADALGRHVHRETWARGKQHGEVAVSGLPAGVYLVQLTTGESRISKRLAVNP